MVESQFGKVILLINDTLLRYCILIGGNFLESRKHNVVTRLGTKEFLVYAGIIVS